MATKIADNLIMQTSNVDEQNKSRETTTSTNSSMKSNREITKTYVAAVAAADPASPMSMKRLAMSGKNRRWGRTRSQQSRECAPQKPDRPSPVQDHKRRGSGGLLSLLPVHAGRRDGEDLEDGGARFWN